MPRGALINLGLLLRLSRLGFVQDVAEYKEEFAGLPETLRAVFNCTLLLGSGTVSGKLLASCLNCCVLSLSMSRCTSQRQVSGKHGTYIVVRLRMGHLTIKCSLSGPWTGDL